MRPAEARSRPPWSTPGPMPRAWALAGASRGLCGRAAGQQTHPGRQLCRRASADAPGAPCSWGLPQTRPGATQGRGTHLALQEVPHLPEVLLEVVLEDDLAPAQLQLCVASSGHQGVGGPQLLHVSWGADTEGGCRVTCNFSVTADVRRDAGCRGHAWRSDNQVPSGTILPTGHPGLGRQSPGSPSKTCAAPRGPRGASVGPGRPPRPTAGPADARRP